jgi:hypothetical protein
LALLAEKFRCTVKKDEDFETLGAYRYLGAYEIVSLPLWARLLYLGAYEIVSLPLRARLLCT